MKCDIVKYMPKLHFQFQFQFQFQFNFNFNFKFQFQFYVHRPINISHLNLIEKLRFLKRSHADKFQGRNLKFSGLARCILETKAAKSQVSN